jgi:hypothetical protein
MNDSVLLPEGMDLSYAQSWTDAMEVDAIWQYNSTVPNRIPIVICLEPVLEKDTSPKNKKTFIEVKISPNVASSTCSLNLTVFINFLRLSTPTPLSVSTAVPKAVRARTGPLFFCGKKCRLGAGAWIYTRFSVWTAQGSHLPCERPPKMTKTAVVSLES